MKQDDTPLTYALLAIILFTVSLLPSRVVEVKKGEQKIQKLPTEYLCKKEVEAIVTKYNPVPEQTDSTPFITASGKKVREGIVACPIWLPFGTRVMINGRVYVCEDRMNPRYQKQWRFDILTFSEKEAKEWGVKKLKVKIL